MGTFAPSKRKKKKETGGINLYYQSYTSLFLTQHLATDEYTEHTSFHKVLSIMP